jgi:uncharacterized protein YvpB
LIKLNIKPAYLFFSFSILLVFTGCTNFIQHFDFPEELPSEINLDVPFTSQAPFGDWGMPYQEACEEASIIMVKHYLSKEPFDADHVSAEIIEMVEWETKNGYGVDINATQTMEVGSHFYGIKGKVFYDEEVTIDNIKRLLAAGHPVVIPAAGRILANPNYQGLGPAYHMLVIKGYDETHFITNDPGTRLGADYKYSYETIDNAIHDWTGSKDTIEKGGRVMFILW